MSSATYLLTEPNLGQNIDILQYQGPALLDSDADSNLIFSIHIRWPSNSHSVSSDYKAVGQCVVGEKPKNPLESTCSLAVFFVHAAHSLQ